MQIASVGIDLGKTTFHLVALNRDGSIVVRKDDMSHDLHPIFRLTLAHDDQGAGPNAWSGGGGTGDGDNDSDPEGRGYSCAFGGDGKNGCGSGYGVLHADDGFGAGTDSDSGNG